LSVGECEVVREGKVGKKRKGNKGYFGDYQPLSKQNSEPQYYCAMNVNNKIYVN
jgi:hypothetical protein